MESHFRIAVVNYSHVFSVLKLWDDKYVGIDGTEFELLKILSKFLNFTYELLCPTDGTWGAVTANGSWNGMMGMLHRNEADLILERIGLSYSRSKVADFTFPYDVDIYTFMIKKARPLATNYYFAYPFQPSVWICIAVSIIICSPLLLLLRHAYFISHKGIYASLMNIIFSAEILIGNGAIAKGFNKVAVKTFFSLCALPLRILMFCFTGLLLSFLMAPLMEKQIETLEQLAVASRIGNVKVTALKGTYTVSIIQRPVTQLLTDLGANLRKYPEATAKSYKDGIKMVNDDYAYVAPQYYLTIPVTDYGQSRNILISNDGLGSSPVSVLFRKNISCTEQFNKVIMRLQQSGIYHKVLNDKFFKLGLKEKLRTDVGQTLRPIWIADLSGVFELLFCGYAISIVILIFERISKSK